LKLIKATNGHATQSVISIRHKIVKNAENSGHPPTGSDSNGSGSFVDFDPMRSKSACLLLQIASLEKMSKDFATSVSNQREFITEKMVGAKPQNLNF
jgi:hypothetical protein